jgi:alpha-D-ribose 1-methylphosphonate 5-triphosphate diphosphatase
MLDALDRTRALVATDLVAQLRFETSLLDQYEPFFDLVTRHNVPFVVFNDHLPHDALAAGKRPPRLTGQALKSGRSPEAHLEMLQALHNNGPEVALALPELAARLRALGVLIGAHDLHTPADHADMAAMGARLAEFPETREAAEAARSAGHPVVMGAPNVLRGGSHKKNVSAADLVKVGLCDALASDYHYPALAQAALGFVAEMGWSEAWALVSKNPAQILGFKDRGEIATGQRADFIVMNAATQRIEATFVAGRPSFMTGDAALAFM